MDLMPAGPDDVSFNDGVVPDDRPFTRQEALASGVSDHHLAALVSHGVLRRPIRGVYVAAELEDTLVLRCQVLALVVPSHAFVCDRTAAWVHVGDRALGPNEHLSVPSVSCFTRSGHNRLRNRLVASGERRIVPDDLMEVAGLTMTTPLRTALDLGRLGGSRVMKLAGLDAMLSTGAFTTDHMLAELPRFRGQRGVILLRVLVPRADGGADSFGESALRDAWYEGGLPRPETQVPVQRPGLDPYRIDVGLAEERFGAEYFGERWHGDEEADHDETRLDYLREAGQWDVEVFRRPDVFGRSRRADVLLRERWQEHLARRPRPLLLR